MSYRLKPIYFNSKLKRFFIVFGIVLFVIIMIGSLVFFCYFNSNTENNDKLIFAQTVSLNLNTQCKSVWQYLVY